MPQTILSGLINPEVMADMISASLPAKIKFAPLATVDTTLVGQPGDTITVPKYTYIGDALDVAEGIAMGTTVLTSSSTPVTVKKAGKAVEITDESALSGYGDPIGEANAQLEKSIAAKVDNDCVTALTGATLVFDDSLNVISYTGSVSAVDKFIEEDDEARILFIHPLQKTTIRLDPEFTKASAMGDELFMTGVIGEIAGCQVYASSKVPVSAGVYSNFIVKRGALTIYMKKDVDIETDRDILAKTTVIAADEHYVVALSDESKAVLYKTKQ